MSAEETGTSWVRRYARASLNKSWTLLALYIGIAAVALFLGTKIEVQPDLGDLLPGDAPSVTAIDESRARRGSSDYFVLAVSSPDPLANVQLIDDLAEQVATWEEVTAVEPAQDRSFFRDNALLYLPVADLTQILDTLKRMIRRELGRSNPLFIDLESGGANDEEDELDWQNPDVWVHPMTRVELGLTADQLARMFPFLEIEGATVVDPNAPPSAVSLLPEEYQDYRISPDGTVAILMSRVDGPESDLRFIRAMYERGTALIDSIDLTAYHPEMRAEVVGAYRGFLEVQAATRDAAIATGISIGLVLLLLIGFFRSFRAVGIVLLPLFFGIAWTLGTVFLLYGRLNALTLFIFAMLIGMGIDFGIHLYSRAIEAFRRGDSWEDALTEAIGSTGRALLTATATTVAALLALVFASFVGFREFGITCGIGVAICFISAIIVMPVLVGVTERIRPLKRPVIKEASNKVVKQRGFGVLRFAALAVIGLSVAGALVAQNVEFENNFRNLSGSGTGQTIRYGTALGPARSSTPAVILGESEAQMRLAHAELRERLRSGDSRINQFTTIETLLPGDQDERMEIIAEIYDELDRGAVRRMDGEMGDALTNLRDMTDVSVFGVDDLPPWAVEQLTERDGTFGSMGLLYARVNQSDTEDVAEFQSLYQEMELSDGSTVRLATSAFIFADVLRYVKADGAKLGLYVAAALLLILIIDIRRPLGVVLCFGALGAGVLMTALWMNIYDMKLGLYNIIAMPLVLGVGIDGAVHVYHRYLEEGSDRMWHVLRTTGVSVSASSITTAAGFFGLMLIDHKGIRTIGQLAVTGVICALIAVLALLPGILSLIGKKDPVNPIE